MHRFYALSIFLVLGLLLSAPSAWSSLQIAYCPDNNNHAVVVITSDGQHRIQQDFVNSGGGAVNNGCHINPLDFDGSDGFDEILLDELDAGTNNGFGNQLWSAHINGTSGGSVKHTNDSNWFNNPNTGTNGTQTYRKLCTVANPGGGTIKCLLTIGAIQMVRISSIDGTTYANGTFQDHYSSGVCVVSLTPNAYPSCIGAADADNDGTDEIFYWWQSSDAENNTLHRCNFINNANANDVRVGPGVRDVDDLSTIASKTLLIGDVDGNGVKDLVVLNEANMHLLYAPINATLPVTWTDSGTTVSMPFPPGGGDLYGIPLAVGNVDADPQEEVIFVGPDGVGSSCTAHICTRDLVTKALTVLPENVLDHGFAGATAGGMPDPNDPLDPELVTRKGYAALTVGHFVDDALLAQQVPIELSAFQLE